MTTQGAIPATGTGCSAPVDAVDPDLRAAFDALDRANVGWLVLRGSVDGGRGDVDLLVDPSARALVGPALTAAGFVHRRAPEHRPHRLFVRRSSAGWLVLDVLHEVEPVGARSHPFPIAAELIERSSRDVLEVPRPSTEDAAWLALLRAGRPGALSVDMSSIPSTLEGPVPGLLDDLVGSSTASHLLAAVSGADPASASRALAPITSVLRPRPRPLPRFIRRVRDALAWRSEGRNGVAVAVLGPDGAGKSTLIAGLCESLPFAVSVHYLGVFRTSERERLLRRIPGVALAGKLATLRIRSLSGALGTRRGRIVLYDRHVVDALLRPGKHTFRSRVSYGLLARACPPPDLFVVLDAPGEVMFARKGEHTVGILEERRQRYLDLRQRYDQLEVVDATASESDVRRIVETLIWQHYAGESL
ncbi:unannotated protein [freshwater metagenome]|uniref:Unannotated protein n=1 Tax=freshwater metagenome TaxID=449393 RepID=A0A6J7KXC3_9ZZZZ|nr:hypothetical protein [Actinomycetota bacterium]